MNDLKRRLQDIDCVVEVHDARIPFTGRNSRFREILQVRPHILALNKMDLADLSDKATIEQRLKQQGITQIIYINCKDHAHDTVKNKVIPTVKAVVDSGPRFHRSRADAYQLLIIGVPNVGKSSLINALRRIHLRKGKATRVGAIAGVTKSVLEKIKVSESPPIYTYDSPGILHPNIANLEAGMKLALCATMKDYLVGEEMIADYMLYWLNKNEHFGYVKHLDIPRPTDSILELLAHIAKTHNFTQIRKTPETGLMVRPDFVRAAQLVLKEFREGRMGKFNLDEDLLKLGPTMQTEVDLDYAS